MRGTSWCWAESLSNHKTLVGGRGELWPQRLSEAGKGKQQQSEQSGLTHRTPADSHRATPPTALCERHVFALWSFPFSSEQAPELLSQEASRLHRRDTFPGLHMLPGISFV